MAFSFDQRNTRRKFTGNGPCTVHLRTVRSRSASSVRVRPRESDSESRKIKEPEWVARRATCATSVLGACCACSGLLLLVAPQSISLQRKARSSGTAPRANLRNGTKLLHSVACGNKDQHPPVTGPTGRGGTGRGQGGVRIGSRVGGPAFGAVTADREREHCRGGVGLPKTWTE